MAARLGSADQGLHGGQVHVIVGNRLIERHIKIELVLLHILSQVHLHVRVDIELKQTLTAVTDMESEESDVPEEDVGDEAYKGKPTLSANIAWLMLGLLSTLHLQWTPSGPQSSWMHR
jgi:hypothetical protein